MQYERVGRLVCTGVRQRRQVKLEPDDGAAAGAGSEMPVKLCSSALRRGETNLSISSQSEVASVNESAWPHWHGWPWGQHGMCGCVFLDLVTSCSLLMTEMIGRHVARVRFWLGADAWQVMWNAASSRGYDTATAAAAATVGGPTSAARRWRGRHSSRNTVRGSCCAGA